MAIDIGSFGSSFANIFGGIMKGGYIMLYIAIFAIIAFVLGYVIIRPLRYKIRVIIWAARGGTGIVEAVDKGRIVRGGGLFNKSPVGKLKLMKRKLALPIPEINHFVRGEKGDTIYYYKYGDTDYVPIMFGELKEKFTDLQLNPSEEDMKLWWISEHKDLVNRNSTKDFINKYGMLIAAGGIIIGIIIVTWIISGTLKEYISAAQTIAAETAKMAENMAIIKAPPPAVTPIG